MNQPAPRPKIGQLGIHIFKREDGDFGIRIVAANNEPIMTNGEGLKNKADALHIAQRLKQLAATAEIYDLVL